MPQRRVTVQQLATQLGLSKFSISRALSGKPGVGDATRARVLRAAHQLGYRRPPDGRPSIKQVLFIIQDEDEVSSEILVNMLHGAEREGARRGIAIIPRHARHLGDFSNLDPSVVGLVLAILRPAELSAAVTRTGLPVVCAGYAGTMEAMDQVVGADWEGGIAVARFLTRLGHRSLGFVRGKAGLFGRTERLRGLRDGARETDGASVAEIAFEEPGGFRDAFFDVVRSGCVPTALFCAHDGLAVTAISELLHLGIRVPHDISVVGFNDFVCATQIAPQLTTLRIPQEEIGIAVIRCLALRLAQADTERISPLRIALMPEFIERRSTAPPGSRSWAKRIGARIAGLSTA